MKLTLVTVGLLAGCGGTLAHVAPIGAHGVRIGRPDVVQRGVTTKRMELPFGQAQNGNVLVRELLLRADELGARYVADLTFHMVFKRRGAVIECETKAVFRDDPLLRASPPAHSSSPAQGAQGADYSTDVSSFEPRLVSYTAHERDLGCRRVGVQVIERKPRYDSLYDVELRSVIDKVPTDRETRVEYRDACDLHPIVREVTRYDFQAKLAYVPPDWRAIGARYADEPIVESPPMCYVIDPAELGGKPTHRLTATLVFPGKIDQRAPLRAPSAPPDDLIRSQHQRQLLEIHQPSPNPSARKASTAIPDPNPDADPDAPFGAGPQ